MFLFGVNDLHIGSVPPRRLYLHIAAGIENDQQFQILARLWADGLPVACLRDPFQQYPVVENGDCYAFAHGRREKAEGRNDIFFLGIEGACQAMGGGAAVISFKVYMGGGLAYLYGVEAGSRTDGFR